MVVRLLVLSLMVSATTACVETRVVRESFASLRAQADKPVPEGGAGLRLDDPTAGAGWSIPLAEYEGDDRYVRVQQLVSALRPYELPQIWYQDVGEKTIVYCGRFTSGSAPEAQLALRSLHTLQIDGERQFRKARVAPLLAATPTRMDPLDLKQYTGFFTLQVAAFTEAYNGDRRAAAEKLARELREQNEDAYFYHGPHNSSVCIGLFTWEDFERRGNIDVPGPRIRALREKHPYNVIDGRDPRTLSAEAPPQGDDPAQQPAPSFLARVI